MAEQAHWPKTLFSKDEQQNPVTDSVTGEVLCGSRAFQSQAEVDAAGGNAVWHETPQQERAAAQPRAGRAAAGARQQPPPRGVSRPAQTADSAPDPEDEDEGRPTPSVPRRR